MKVYQTVFIGEKNTLLYGRIYLDKEKAIKFLNGRNKLVEGVDVKSNFLGLFKDSRKALRKGKENDDFVLEMEVIE